MPSNAIAPVAATSITTSSSHGECRPIPVSPTKVASAVKAPTVKTSPCENLIMSSTPKNSVKPTATSAYIMPSISPFMTYCAKSPKSIALNSAPSCPPSCRASTSYAKRGRRGWPGQARPLRSEGLLLPRQLALAAGVFAVVPLDELAVLHDVFRDHRDGVLPVIVEGDLADD